MRSFTICGWVGPTSLLVGSGGNRIVFNLNYNRSGFDLVHLQDGRLRLAVNEWPDGVRNDSSPGKLKAGKWTFFAVSYDATDKKNNVVKLGLCPDVRVWIGDHGHSGTPDITETIRWLDYHLNRIDTGIKDEPPIKIQVRHGRWRMERRWPLDGTKFTDYYLSSLDGSRLGSLDRRPPGKELPTRYRYDPNKPHRQRRTQTLRSSLLTFIPTAERLM